MKVWIFIIAVCLWQGIISLRGSYGPGEPASKFTVDQECFLNVSEIIRYHGYPSEEHHIETEDGYILTVFRIPHGRYNEANKGSRPTVFLQHAVLGDASHWISNEPNNSLGFILADAGYDVWLGNSRGNTYSSKHKTLKTHEQKFWEFSIKRECLDGADALDAKIRSPDLVVVGETEPSFDGFYPSAFIFHEMGYYDIPAVIDVILKKTAQDQLYFVGHSEGSTAGFIAFSTWPKLTERIKVFFALAPVTTATFAITPFTKLAQLSETMFRIIFGNKGLFQYPTYLRKPFTTLCNHYPQFCANILFFLSGYNLPNLNMSRLDMYIAHNPAGTSVQNGLHWRQESYPVPSKNLQHLGMVIDTLLERIFLTNEREKSIKNIIKQIHNSKLFQAYDYGSTEKNKEKYNQTVPSIYKIEDIKIPIAFWTGGHDFFVDSRDVAMLSSRISNLIYEKHIPEWQHLDFIWGLDAPEKMYMDIIEIMKTYP